MNKSEYPTPVEEFRVGGTIKASVWRNTKQVADQATVSHSVTLQKRYFDKDEQAWKSSSSFFPNELPKAILALQLAYQHIQTQVGSAAVEEPAA